MSVQVHASVHVELSGAQFYFQKASRLTIAYKTAFGFRMIAKIILKCLFSIMLSASGFSFRQADKINVSLDNSRYHAQPHQIIAN